MRRGTSRGMALAMVIAVAAVMMILVQGAWAYFRSSVNTAVFRRDRMAAAYAAESGVNLALHHLAGLDPLPGVPFDIFPEGLDLPDGSTVTVAVHPFPAGDPATSNGAAEIRSTGSYRSQEYRIIVRAVPRFLSGFALAVNGDIPSGFFTTGTMVDGPVHSNGTIHFDSFSPDSSDDPWLYEVSVTSRGGVCFSDVGMARVPHPEGSRTWVRPWPRHNRGRPSWRMNQEPVDMQQAALDLRASLQGAVSVSASRVLLDGSRAIFRRGIQSPPETLSLRGVNCIQLSGGYSGTVLKSLSPLAAPLTIFSAGDLVLGGSITGALAGAGGPLGLVSLGDIVIETDPDCIGGEDWESPWDIETDRSFMVRAFLAAPTGRFRPRSNTYPGNPARVAIHGGLATGMFSWTSSGSTGYTLGIAMDPGLVSRHPPGFPQVWKWTPVSWLMDVPEEDF